MNLLVVPEQHALRGAAERFIVDVYKTHYQAAIPSFPPILVAMPESDGRLLCASGLRFARTGFFSDAYLDIPIELALAKSTGRSHIARGYFRGHDVCEPCTSCRNPLPQSCRGVWRARGI